LKPAKVQACKAAAVFDIDETLLSNYEWISTLAVPFSYDSAASNAANSNCTTPPIKATVALFDAFKRLGVTPFLITGRSEKSRAVTESCLAKSGITGYSALILAPVGNTQSAGERKADQRQVLIDKGWKIGPSVGDQVSDMSYGSLSRGFLLPNAMYFLP
ncbi:MAG: HAD family acid phosphatase, partial [Candidatus Nanopelagicales bacterium]